MSCYINIGVVFCDELLPIAPDNIYELSKRILNECDEITIKYSEDDHGFRWEERTYRQNEIMVAVNTLEVNKLAIGKLKYRIQQKEYNILISIRKKDNKLWGLLLEIPEEELFVGDYSKDKFNYITNKIIINMKNMLTNVKFGYAFCDCDAEIEYSLSEVLSKNNYYSILLLNNLTVRLAPWNIDGITPR